MNSACVACSTCTISRCGQQSCLNPLLTPYTLASSVWSGDSHGGLGRLDGLWCCARLEGLGVAPMQSLVMAYTIDHIIFIMYESLQAI